METEKINFRTTTTYIRDYILKHWQYNWIRFSMLIGAIIAPISENTQNLYLGMLIMSLLYGFVLMYRLFGFYNNKIKFIFETSDTELVWLKYTLRIAAPLVMAFCGYWMLFVLSLFNAALSIFTHGYGQALSELCESEGWGEDEFVDLEESEENNDARI